MVCDLYIWYGSSILLRSELPSTKKAYMCLRAHYCGTILLKSSDTANRIIAQSTYNFAHRTIHLRAPRLVYTQ